MLFIMSNTVDLGITPNCKKINFVNKLITAFLAAEQMHIMGFEPLINQRLLPPTFPRYTKIKPRAESLTYFEDVVHRFKIMVKIQSLSALHQVLVVIDI